MKTGSLTAEYCWSLLLGDSAYFVKYFSIYCPNIHDFVM